MSKVNLVLGDWSNDGHGKTEVFSIESNLSVIKIADAYTKGTQITGVNLERDVAAEYEDGSISSEDVEKLVKAGFKGSIEETECIGQDEYVELWLFTAKLGNPDFEYTIIENYDLHIGGYGLFS